MKREERLEGFQEALELIKLSIKENWKTDRELQRQKTELEKSIKLLKREESKLVTRVTEIVKPLVRNIVEDELQELNEEPN